MRVWVRHMNRSGFEIWFRARRWVRFAITLEVH